MTHKIVIAAVTSSMMTAATSVFAWTFSRFTDTVGYRYCAPMVVFGTVWLMTGVFASSVAWHLAADLVRRPYRRPGSRPPRDPRTLSPEPRPNPQRERLTEITLVDLEPIQDLTQEIPVVPSHVLSRDWSWRPPVSPTAKEHE